LQVNSNNPYFTENIYLLCDDWNLEPMAAAINDVAAAGSVIAMLGAPYPV
jgi:hypothetical protein